MPRDPDRDAPPLTAGHLVIETMEKRYMSKVLNMRQAGKRSTETQVYIERPSKWGIRSSSDAMVHARM